VIGQPLANIDLIDSVDCVSGKIKLIDFVTACIPSTGHIMPKNIKNVINYLILNYVIMMPFHTDITKMLCIFGKINFH
jgi:hypothetical protein